jgi:hypothetical protein
MLINLTLVLAALNVSLIYLKKYVTLKDSVKGTRVHAAWASLFLGYAMMILFYWFGALYTSSLDERYHVLQFGYLSAATGGFFFIYHVEQLTYLSVRRVFTPMFGILYITLVVLMAIAFIVDLGNIVQYFATSFWVPNLGFIAVFLYKMNRLSRGKLRGVSFFMMGGFAFLILGILGSTDLIQRSLGLGTRVLADAFQIVGVVIIGAFSARVPTWKELEWEKAFDSLLVIYKGGLLLYEHKFGDARSRIDGGKVATAVSVLEATRMFLTTAIGSGELKVLDFDKRKLYFETGKYVTVVTVANQELDTLGFIIHKIRIGFERGFASSLVDWNGDSSVFDTASAMINRIMS